MININEETSIRLLGDWTSPEAERLSAAWFSSLAMEHKLPDAVRYMDGMSGKKYRYLINNLVENTPDARYLEVGSWRGSTAASAVWGNTCSALCIDNWSDFLWGDSKENVRAVFEQNLKAASGTTADSSFIDRDFRQVDYSDIGRFNVYMFDGPHSEQDQYDGVVIAQPALDDTYYLIVDDYNGPGVRAGTERAIKDLNLTVVAAIEIITRSDDQHPQISMQHSDWHNGYFIALVKKAQS
jgi:hypothetical protein